jgi:hypothetical protein
MKKINRGWFKKGHKVKMTNEWKKKISISKTGVKLPFRKRKKQSKEHIEKRMKNFRGKGHWTYGKKFSKEHIKKLSISHLGHKPSLEQRIQQSNRLKGEKSHLWKGGITPENTKIRRSIELRLWREAVFARDNWTCQKYKIRGCHLVAHHINNFSEYPELRFAIDNGITLSEKAHKEFHKKYGFKNNTKEQLIEFLN